MNKFILAEYEETYDTLHPYGEISSELKGVKIVAEEEKDYIIFRMLEGGFNLVQNEDGGGDKDFVVEDSTNFYEVHKKDFNIKEVERLLEYLRG